MENKKCVNCSGEFFITDKEVEFFGKLKVPFPKSCPDCRCQRRFAFRNERNLYKVKSWLSGKDLISCLHPSENLKILSGEEWWGDKWDGLDFGRDYDFNKPFFEQFAELQKEVPMIGLHVANNENTTYANYTGDCKNCYMVFGPVYSEDCLYGSPYYCKDCIDSLLVRDSELCYECVTCQKCYRCFFCQDCSNSSELSFCYDCQGCTDCIGCMNLRNKKFHVFNKKMSESEYKELKKSLDFCNKEITEEIEKNFKELKAKLPHRYANMLKTEKCSGDYIYESKNSENCFDVQRCWDCHNLAQTIDMKDCQDCNYTEENELCYEYIGYYQNNNLQFSIGCHNTVESKYSSYCMSCKNLFGCTGLKRKQYCILNKQYSKEEYEELLPKIIEHIKSTGEYGEFFPISISPFCYNETVAQEYFPLTKEQALSKGYRWREKDPKEYLVQKVVIPKSIDEVSESIVSEILACKECGKNFKIQPAEFYFYKKQKLPIPDFCADCRHKRRLSLRNARKIYDRECYNCHAEIKTTYSETRPEKAYCEECYLNSID